MSANIECICVNAWINSDHGQTYCDPSEQTPDGWTVYERTVNDSGGCFDLPYEQDFPTYEAALEAAESRSAIHNAPIREY